MIKVLLACVLLFGLFFAAIRLALNITGKEAVALTKIVMYSIICAVLTIAVLISIVVIF